jgi:hypothetical protein
MPCADTSARWNARRARFAVRAKEISMRCPACGRDGVQFLIDAYVIYDAVSEDGVETVGPPRIQTFDKDRFLECRDCGWKSDCDVTLADTSLVGALDA